MNWEHLRSFEAVARLGSLTVAAKALDVSQSTISRQLSRLEAEARSPLLVRESPVRVTERGAALLAAVRPMVTAALAAESALIGSEVVQGKVSVTTVGEFLRWVLIDHLAEFYDQYPGLRLRILADNRISSLAAGEADIALRFARPERGDLIARRIHRESYGLFAAASLAVDHETPWLGLAGSLADIPEQEYAERVFADRPARLWVEDVESLGLAVQRGLGIAVLSRFLTERLPGLREVTLAQIGCTDIEPVAARDLWLVVHRVKHRLPAVRAVMEWLYELFVKLPNTVADS